ncbi:MAG: O-methyltransferase [Actinomycetota bacterium]|nr:O-methyltransferase [Actinomycetota bacterium]
MPEDVVLATARARGEEVGVAQVSPAAGATLCFLAAVTGARAVIEIGTGTGVSGTWLLRGMRPDGVLTSIDGRGDHQQVARQTFREAGFPTPRTRLIAGQALQVLPRLSDGAYDLVSFSAGAAETADYVEEAVRLLRVGGVLAVENALWGDRVADPSARDPETVAVREVGRALRDDPRLVPTLLPVGDGLLVAVKL